MSKRLRLLFTFQSAILTAIFALALAPGAARALSFGDVLLDGTVGGGTNEAIILIDWDTGVTPSHAWLFRWDGLASYAMAYDAIQAASGGAFSWSGGNFASFIEYDDGAELHETTNLGWLSFWNSADGESWNLNGGGLEDTQLVDGGWAGGNANIDPTDSWPGAEPGVPLVPEPTTAALLGLGLAGLAARRSRAG